jgi:hypothetical protein
VTYFGLKKLGRRELGWIIAPMLALALTAGFYVAGVVTGGEPLVLSRLSVVTLGETAQGKLAGGATSIGTLYSSNRLDLQLNVAEQAQATSLGRNQNIVSQRNSNPAPDFATVQQGPGGGFGKILLGQDDQRTFALEGPTPEEIGGGILAHLTAQGNELVGTLENRSGTDWTDLSVWKAGSLIYQIPVIKAGETITLQKSYSIDRTGDSLAFILAGREDAGNGPSNFARLYGSQLYLSQKAAALATLIGMEGEVLPKDPNRAYLIAWKQAAFNFPLEVQNHPASNNDLTLLFEPVVLT